MATYEKTKEEHYCNFCLMEVEIDEQDNCINCGNPISQEMLEKDEEISNLAYENKMMAEALAKTGLTQEEISTICSGDLSNVAKTGSILITEDDVKARVIESYTCDAENGSKDYDSYMEDDNANLTLWEPFENYPIEWIREQISNDVDSTLAWLNSFKEYNTTDHAVLVKVEDSDRSDVEGFEDVLFYDTSNFLETSGLKAQVIPMSYFLEMLNNEEIIIDDFWVTQIRLEK